MRLGGFRLRRLAQRAPARGQGLGFIGGERGLRSLARLVQRGDFPVLAFAQFLLRFFQQAAAVLAQRVDLQGDFQARGFQIAGGGGAFRPRAAALRQHHGVEGI